MAGDTEQFKSPVKVEAHDKRIWFGLTQDSLWKLVITSFMLWMGLGKPGLAQTTPQATGDRQQVAELRQTVKQLQGDVQKLDTDVAVLTARLDDDLGNHRPH